MVSKNEHFVSIEIPVPKIYSLRLDFGSYPEKVKIKNLKLEGEGVLLFNNTEDFYLNQIEEFNLENDSLIISSKQIDPFMVYKTAIPFNGAKHVYINWINLLKYVILFVFVYFIVFRLLKLFIDQSSLLVSLSNVALFLAFLVIVVAPLCKIDDSDISQAENRTLAKFPNIVNNGELNFNFGNEFNTWFNDRFFGRAFLSSIKNNVDNLNEIIRKNDYVCFTSNDVCTHPRFEWKDMYYNEFNKYPEVLGIIQEKLQPEKTYAIFFPHQFLFYCDYIFLNDSFCNTYLDEDIEKINQNFNKNPNVKMISLYKYFKNIQNEYPNDLLYFKNDHHATEYADLKALELIPEIKSLNDVTPKFTLEVNLNIRADTQWNFSKYGQSYNFVNASRGKSLFDSAAVTSNKETSYNYVSTSKEYKECIESKDLPNPIANSQFPMVRLFVNKCVNNELRVLVTGNSFTENFSRVIATKAKYVLRVRTHHANWSYAFDNRVLDYLLIKDVLDFKPNLIFAVNALGMNN